MKSSQLDPRVEMGDSKSYFLFSRESKPHDGPAYHTVGVDRQAVKVV